jgi:SOS-response transcriptional repressor LexA
VLEWATDDAAPTGAAITLAIRRAPTARQLKVLDFLREYTATHGYPPTLREIGAHMGIRSTNGVNDHLRALERKGLIRRSMMLSRSCVPVDVSPTGDSFAHAIEGWRTENAALVTLLKKVQARRRVSRN